MPTPRSQYNISVKVSGGTASDVYILFRNGNTKEYKKVLTVSDEAVVNVGELSSDGTETSTKTGVSNNDVIEISATGYRYGGTHHTVNTNKGGAKISLTLTDISTTNAPAVNF